MVGATRWRGQYNSEPVNFIQTPSQRNALSSVVSQRSCRAYVYPIRPITFRNFAMTLRCVLVVLALAGATFAGPEVTELKVDVVSVPEGCSVKSKHGDMLTMHYTGTLDDGHKFDSRLVTFSFNTLSMSRISQAMPTVISQRGSIPAGTRQVASDNTMISRCLKIYQSLLL